MKRAEAMKLLGGYAAGTLTEAERKLLFEAALENQELFEALADEEALRELLSDLRVRRRLLEALAEPEAGLGEWLWAWWRRPVAWGVAGSVAVAALLVVMLAPVYQTAKRPVVQPVAQAPFEMAKRAEPAAPQAAPAAAAAPWRQPAAAPAKSALAGPAAPEPPAEQRVAERAEEKEVLAEAQVKPKLEAAPGGVVGGVVGGIVAAAPQVAALEGEARTLYYAPVAEPKAVSPAALRAKRAADVAAAPAGPVGIRYSIQKLGAEGQYAEAAPSTVFVVGDLIRLSVEANQSGLIRLLQRNAAGGWNQVAQIHVEARVRQTIPAAGLRLEASETLVLELTREEGLAAAGQPVLQRAADERAVYVVDPAGGAALRTEINLTVR